MSFIPNYLTDGTNEMGPMGKRKVGGVGWRMMAGKGWGGHFLGITISLLYFFRPLKMTSLGLQIQAVGNGENSNH